MSTTVTTTPAPPPASRSFATIGAACGTDKVTHHAYERFYPREIDFIHALRGVGIIEIGLFNGASLRLWLDYFASSGTHVYGLDIDCGGGFERERVSIVEGDQSSPADLQRLVGALRHPIYFVNDDGSHIPEHQLLTFETLFPVLENGGVYIIEDVETSYWTRGEIYGYPTRYGPAHERNVVNVFKRVADYVNREFLTPTALAALLAALATAGLRSRTALDAVRSVTFAHNCVIVHKVETARESRLMARPYRGAHFL